MRPFQTRRQGGKLRLSAHLQKAGSAAISDKELQKDGSAAISDKHLQKDGSAAFSDKELQKDGNAAISDKEHFGAGSAAISDKERLGDGCAAISDKELRGTDGRAAISDREHFGEAGDAAISDEEGARIDAELALLHLEVIKAAGRRWIRNIFGSWQLYVRLHCIHEIGNILNPAIKHSPLRCHEHGALSCCYCLHACTADDDGGGGQGGDGDFSSS